MGVNRACVLGAGNAAHVVAGLVSSQPGWECSVYAPRKDRAERWRRGMARGGIRVVYTSDGGEVIQGRPSRVSRDPGEVVPGSQLLILCLPAQAYDENLAAVAPHMDRGAVIGTISASNGFDWCVDAAMASAGRRADSYGVFALINLPWVCRIEAYGEEVQVRGAKPQMELVARPTSRMGELSATLSRLLRVRCPAAKGGFIGAGLANICQVIHPWIMQDNFASWDGETPFAAPPLFYQGLSEAAADNIHRASSELMAVRAALEGSFPGLVFPLVRHVMDWLLWAYDRYITDPSTLRSRFVTNRAYTGLTCPMTPLGRGYAPDYTHRYLTEDVPFNLVTLRGLAQMCGVPTPVIDDVIEWSQGVMGREYLVGGELRGEDLSRTFAPQRFGFTRLEQLPEVIAFTT